MSIRVVSRGPGASLTVGSGRSVRPYDNGGLINCLVQVFWHLESFNTRFSQDITASTVSPTQLPVTAALAAIFKQLEDAQENQIVRGETMRVALMTAHANDLRLILKEMDDGIACYSAIVEHLRNELENKGTPSAGQIVRETLLLKLAGTPVDRSLCVMEVSAKRLLSADLRANAVITAAELDQITGLNLTEVLEKYGLPNHHSRILDFGRLVGPATMQPDQTQLHSILNAPLNLVFGVNWTDKTNPSLEDIKAVLAAISPVISQADIFNVDNQNMAGQPKAVAPKKKAGLFGRLMARSNDDRDEAEDDNDVLTPSRFMTLQAVIAYHGQHYVAFYYSAVLKLWLFYDDTRVSKVGPHFSEMITKIGRGRYQPLLLFYQAADPVTAKNVFRQFVSRRFSRRDESLFGHLENMDQASLAQIMPKAAGGSDGVAPMEDAFADVRLSDGDKSKLRNMPSATSSSKSVTLTRGEAVLAMQVQHRATEKRFGYRHSFVLIREPTMGIFGKPKERILVLAKRALAFYDPNAQELHPKDPLMLLEIGPSTNLTEVGHVDSSYAATGMTMAAVLRIKSGSHNVELAFMSVLEYQSWVTTLRYLMGTLTLEPINKDDTLMSLFSAEGQMAMEAANRKHDEV